MSMLCLVLRISMLLVAAQLAVAEPYRAGFSTAVITPEEMTWLSGYGARTQPAAGKVHDLYAKAAALEDSAGSRLVLVTLDLGSVNPETTDHVAIECEKRFNLPRARLILNCSHTHSAPEVSAERRVFLGISEAEHAKLTRYIEALHPRLVDLVGRAIADLQPARITISRSQANFAFNRRGPKGIDKNGAVDREVPVMRITDAQGRIRAVLFGYACHNTTIRGQLYSGDYAGFAQRNVEAANPGAVAMFVMGCGGDQNPQPRHGDQEVEHARNHGRELAQAVQHAMEAEQREIGGPLRVAYDVATLALEPLPPMEQLRTDAKLRDTRVEARKARYLLGLIDSGREVPLTQPCPLHVARFGDDLLMIFIGGETVVDYSIRLKREVRGPFVWVAGYCDDVFAYLPSRRVLLEGGYEGRDSIIHQLVATPFEPDVEDRVMECITRLVAEVERD